MREALYFREIRFERLFMIMGSISKPGLSPGQLIDLAWPIGDPSRAMGYGYELLLAWSSG